MATENETPAPEAPVTETPVNETTSPMQVVGGVEVYTSSEEFQRVHALGLQKQKEDEENRKMLTERQKVRATLDKYIVKYSKTTETRKRAKANNKSADHQLDVDAEVVEVLEKIKNELRGK